MQIMRKSLILIIMIFLGGYSAFGGPGAGLTVIEGGAGRVLLSKVIQSNPAAREFFSGVLGVRADKLLSMDPATRQQQILSRLNAQGPDQKNLIEKAVRFVGTEKDWKFGGSLGDKTDISSGEELFEGDMVKKLRDKSDNKKIIPLPEKPATPTRTEPMLKRFSNQLVERGEITPSEARAFEKAVLTTDVEGRDVVRCVTQWHQAENRALYVRTIIAGGQHLPQDPKKALNAIADTWSRNRGISPEEAKRRACALAGAGGVPCNAYGEPILAACR